ncbi:CPBP family intramembrane glutamic endopeptidase [Bacillus sp. JJ1566]|uniref:CPBP family intramembrane glutamic endopeptidase n=1 Tax=Bacillus sp. JJ1566 TaxID=3122961 RepID=UPI002FFED7C7
MGKFAYISVVYFLLVSIAILIQSLNFGIVITILVGYVLVKQKLKLKWLNLQLFGMIIALVYILLSNNPLSHFGLSFGSLNQGWFHYLVITLVMLSVPRLIDYLLVGKLTFKPMKLRTALFWIVIVGFGEEIMFRGIIQSEFGFWAATLSFGLFHAFNLLTVVNENTYTLKHLLNAFYITLLTGAVGAILGYVYYLTQSIVAVALLHGLMDLCNHLWPPQKREE